MIKNIPIPHPQIKPLPCGGSNNKYLIIHTRNYWPKELGRISGFIMVGCEKSSCDNPNISSLHQDMIPYSLHEKVLLKSFQQVEWVYMIVFLLNSIHVIISHHHCRCDSTFLAWQSSLKKFPAGGVGLCGGLRASGGWGLERDLSLSSGEHPPTLPIFNQDSILWKEPNILFCFTSKHLKGHLPPRVCHVTFLHQRDIPGSLSVT